ncbi:hypothetical protein SAMN04488523_12119 [Sulfitobacter brevis]|uniref:Replication protein n=1 Tax=Sulfitobacter brevis TaxID=74348 RepID=A0A1I2GD41_9RHOB|nr:hypothetical protein [Sulfitobacter brevis]SFF14666.1 hypothetical protein SAMN04488523_12119 [Sulfitobacter brevis]
MSQLNRKTTHQLHSFPSNTIKLWIECETLPNYLEYYRQVYCEPERWDPVEHIELLHGQSPDKNNFFSIERNFESHIAGLTEEEIEAWIAEYPSIRKNVKEGRAWRPRSFQTRRLSGDDPDFVMMSYLDSLAGQKDVYVSMSEFGNPLYFGPQINLRKKEKEVGVPEKLLTQVMRYKRDQSNAHHVSALWLDFDNLYNHDLDHRQIAAAFLSSCDLLDKPRPTYIMFTGRGISPVWLLDKHHKVNSTKGCVLARWKLMMNELMDIFRDFQPDPAVVDIARVLRVAGTVNSKSLEVAYPLYVNKTATGEIMRYDIDELSDKILPICREQYLAIAQEKYEVQGKIWARENLKFRAARSARKKHRGQRSREHTIVEDLDKLRELRWGANRAIDDGMRDKWLLIRMSSFAHINAIPVLIKEIKKQGKSIGLSEDEAMSYMSTVIQRADQQVKLLQAQADGIDPASLCLKYYDPSQKSLLYRYSVKTMIKYLNISEEEMRAADLRILIAPDLRRERRRNRAASQRQQTTTPRSREEIASTAKREAHALRNKMDSQNWSIRAAAKELNMTPSKVQRILKHL